MTLPRSTLDCQNCGDVLRELTPTEAQRVARDPYAFIVFCRTCQPDELRRLEREAHGL